MLDDAPVDLIVVFGGAGAREEHHTSCISAANVVDAADPERYRPVPVAITESGDWVAVDSSRFVTGVGGARALASSGPVVDPFDVLGPAPDRQTVVFPLVNEVRPSGPSVAGLCEVVSTPCVGADSIGSSVARDKSMTRRAAESLGIDQPAWLCATRDTSIDSIRTAVRRALGGFPVFVKPASYGYSVGITKARSDTDLVASLETALAVDDVALVEEAIPGREIEVGLVGTDAPRISVAGEIIPRSEFYTFDDKTAADGARMVVPADLPSRAIEDIEHMARAVCVTTRCVGMARVDFFYDEGGRGVVFNEVNNVPGLTTLSMFPRVWAASGVAMPELVDELVADARERHAVGRARLT